MKIKDGFVLREVAGDTVVLPSGDLEINAMITLNESAAFLWKKMQEETSVEQLVQAVVDSYPDGDAATAKLAVEGFVQQLKENDFLA